MVAWPLKYYYIKGPVFLHLSGTSLGLKFLKKINYMEIKTQRKPVKVDSIDISKCKCLPAILFYLNCTLFTFKYGIMHNPNKGVIICSITHEIVNLSGCLKHQDHWVSIYNVIAYQIISQWLCSVIRKDSDKLVKITLIREAGKRVRLGPDLLPSICFYSILNAHTR